MVTLFAKHQPLRLFPGISRNSSWKPHSKRKKDVNRDSHIAYYAISQKNIYFFYKVYKIYNSMIL